MKISDQVKAIMKKKSVKKGKAISFTQNDLLSTGSTLLNLAYTDNPYGGLVKGRYFFMIGDSSSGKTFTALTCLAEACINKNFDDYRLIYDNIEDGALMDWSKYFGKKAADRISAPYYDPETGEPVYHKYVEDFYYYIDDLLKERVPFIYVLDSQDALSSNSEEDKFEDTKKKSRAGKEAAGSYGDGKAKIHSANLRRTVNALRDTGSILIIVGQTRDNLGFGFEKKTRSGGRALKFYAHMESWSSVAGKLEKSVNGKKRELGIKAQITVKKNRFTGKRRTVTVPIYTSIGIDDIGSCIDYLVEEKRIKTKKGVGLISDDFGFEGSRLKLIRHIEENDMYEDLQAVVGEVWAQVEEACIVTRRSRYE